VVVVVVVVLVVVVVVVVADQVTISPIHWYISASSTFLVVVLLETTTRTLTLTLASNPTPCLQDHGIHERTEVCDNAGNGMDFIMAATGTGLFWFTAFPIIHLCLKG